jgi:hypothetical protein
VNFNDSGGIINDTQFIVVPNLQQSVCSVVPMYEQITNRKRVVYRMQLVSALENLGYIFNPKTSSQD